MQIRKLSLKRIYLLVQKVKKITYSTNFIILFDKLVGPVLLLVFKSSIISFTSSDAVGNMKKIYGLGCLR